MLLMTILVKKKMEPLDYCHWYYEYLYHRLTPLRPLRLPHHHHCHRQMRIVTLQIEHELLSNHNQINQFPPLDLPHPYYYYYPPLNHH